MKRLLLLLTIALTVLDGQAQKTLSPDYAFKVSEPYRVFDALAKFYFTKGNEALALKFDGKEVLIQKFNTDKPAFIKEQRYEKFFPKNYQIESVLEMGDHFYFFFSSWDGDNDKEQLFSIEIDFAKGEFIGQPKLVFDVAGHIAGAMGFSSGFMSFSAGITDKFDFLQSQDKKNVLIQYRKKPEVKNDKKSFDIIGLYAYDSNLVQLSKSEVTMPYTERRMNNLDYQLDNKGNMYLLTKVFHDDSNEDKKKKKDVEANYHLELFLIKAGSSAIEISKFENKDKFINKLWLFDTDKDYLICAGFYSNGQGHFDDCDGIASFKVRTDGSIYDQVFHEIPVAVLNQYESAKTVKKNEKKERKGDNAQFSDLELREISVNKDGSLILIGEQYFVVAHTSYSQSGGSHTTYTYHYCDMLVSKINSDGSLGWMKKITKNQVGGRGKGGMSFKYFNAHDSHYFVFLDNVKNIDLPLTEEPKKHSDGKGGYLTSVRIEDKSGDLRKGSILNAKDVEDFQIYQFAVNRIFKTDENSFMLEVYKKKKEDVMIKVSLN